MTTLRYTPCEHELLRFYDAYALWLVVGAPTTDPIFLRGATLCALWRRYIAAKNLGRPFSAERRRLKGLLAAHFKRGGLDSATPFNTSLWQQTAEVWNERAHLNRARVQWVTTHAPNYVREWTV